MREDRVIGRSGDRRDRVIGNTANVCHPEQAQVPRSGTSARRRTPRMLAAANAASGISHQTLPAPYYSERNTKQVSGHEFTRAEQSKKIWALAPAVFKDAIHIALATLREIFDESAYDRFLARTRTQRSSASYSVFLQEKESSALARPRCC